MGLNLCKCSLPCCCCRCCKGKPQNSVGILPDKSLKLLLLGLSGSGKTEIAHYLAKIQRLDYEATNGVHTYCFKLMETKCLVTEIGGNDDMQRIWHHYFAGTMGVIYCFDMAAGYDDLNKAFLLLQNLLKNPYIMAKPILLVATKADLADESIQLFDIENTFQVQKMASSFGCSIKLCCYDPRTENNEENANTNLTSGLNWMVANMLNNYSILQMRLNSDKNMQKWEQQRDKLIAEGKLNLKKYERFPKRCRHNKFWRLAQKRVRHGLSRPRTAPSKITSVSTVEQSTMTSLTTALDFSSSTVTTK